MWRILRPASPRLRSYQFGLDLGCWLAGPATATCCPAQLDATDDKVHPHLFVTPPGCAHGTQGMSLISALDGEHAGAGSFHRHCPFEVNGDSGTP